VSKRFVKTLVPCALLMMSLTLFGQQAPPPPAPPTRIGGDVAQANLVVQTPAVYPPLAAAARVQDYVILQAVIGKDGKVGNLTILRGHPLLNEAALQAVQQWQYKPQLLNGQPIDVITTVTVDFSLFPVPNAPRLPAGSASISGRLRLADGRPATSVFVFAVVAGEGTPETKAISAQVNTDSTGVYRIENLPPGTYHIQAGVRNKPFTYYPGVADVKDAVAVTVADGQTTIVGIDFPLP
jgi:TonB family protein